MDVVYNFELDIINWFTTTKSFLKIGNFKLDVGENIFYSNDKLYIPLKNTGVLPFTKL